MPMQDQWRFCNKCSSMFFDGYPAKGICTAGGGHEAAGYNFALPHDVPPNENAQDQWRFCNKCHVIFFDGTPEKGTCPVGGVHAPAGYGFVLPHDFGASSNAQDHWRYCVKCQSLFYDGYPMKGRCPAGAGHQAAGYDFVIAHDLPPNREFDTGYLTSDLPLGGSIHLTVFANGDFKAKIHAHGSGFSVLDYGMSAVLTTANGVAFTISRAGRVEGTSTALPFGTPRRDDDVERTGHNQMIADLYGDIVQSGRLTGTLTGVDKLQAGLSTLLEDAAKQLAIAGIKAVVALI